MRNMFARSKEETGFELKTHWNGWQQVLAETHWNLLQRLD